ncbi:MAG: M14 family zinc carboxypeptidase [Solirubrobacterales bacterium]
MDRSLRPPTIPIALILVSGLIAGVLPGAAATTPAEPVGTSVRGEPIEAIRLGDPNSPRKALVVGEIHGDEPGGLKITAALRRDFSDIQGVDLWIVDAANPDGLAAHRRPNAHRVDLNRNWSYRWREGRHDGYYPGPAPFSEPESRAMRDLIERLQPQVSVWYHQPWNAVLVPCHGPAPLQRRYARLAHMKRSCRGDKLRGTAIQWQNHTFPGTTAIVVELGPGRISKAVAERNARAVAAIAGG